MARGKSAARKRKPIDLMAKLPHETDLQWRGRVAREMANQRDQTRPLVSPFAAQHGEHVPAENGSRLNSGASPLVRWQINKSLTVSQLAAIEMCLRIWKTVGIPSRSCTASYGEQRGGVANLNESEHAIMKHMEARSDLRRIEAYFPSHYWEIFENCIRFDEPAGIAGSRLGFGDRTAQARAHQVVCLVADMIAVKERITY
jgi:hypothetical protein